jgi:hypothetical protein
MSPEPKMWWESASRQLRLLQPLPAVDEEVIQHRLGDAIWGAVATGDQAHRRIAASE